ncbi:MAG: hypothetical protein J6Z40_04360 [Oscillospiraceae bacterium]|nr:hypothetical protein [Oscillospiraceae bacterium]MBQ9908078.1 hypothetical protein [Oscillospiraceae bacterium]
MHHSGQANCKCIVRICDEVAKQGISGLIGRGVPDRHMKNHRKTAYEKSLEIMLFR